jgi:hypothetical protein
VVQFIRVLFLLVIFFSANAQTVYKTPYGAKYHTATCRTVKNVSAAISVSEAVKLGLQPCKICKPETVPGQRVVQGKAQGAKPTTTQCNGKTKAGTRCKHMTSIANGYCFQHQPQVSSKPVRSFPIANTNYKPKKNMDVETKFIIIVTAAIVLQCMILYLVIVLATRPSFREKQMNQAIDLLVHIARAHGVPEEHIEKVFK